MYITYTHTYNFAGIQFMKTLPMAFPLLNVGPEQGYVDQVPNPPAPLRSYFPETWLWELVPTGYFNL